MLSMPLDHFHYPRTYWFSRGPTVPVLIDNEVTLADSSAILKFLDQYAAAGRELYPAEPSLRAEVQNWERLFDDELGVESRRWVYFHMLPHPLRGLRTAGDRVPGSSCCWRPFVIRRSAGLSPANSTCAPKPSSAAWRAVGRSSLKPTPASPTAVVIWSAID